VPRTTVAELTRVKKELTLSAAKCCLSAPLLEV
jgi:hypothetical protein